MNNLLRIEGLSVKFSNITAVDNIFFNINYGETVCLVGESGSGKTTVGLSILGLVSENGRTSGSILFKNKKINFKDIRGKKIGMVFQEPKISLNPLFSVKTQIEEVLLAHTHFPKEKRQKVILEILKETNILPHNLKKYPHELSGGQIQRVMIAIAAILRPCLLIADEICTALDIITQNKILDLLKKLKKKHNMSMLFITHNLALAYEIADRIIVMKKGKIIEENDKKTFFRSPCAEYSKHLLDAIPRIYIE